MDEIKMKIMLDVGCGFNKQHGWIGMDKRDVEGVDIVHDAEVFPWPLDDESCSNILLSHLIEHIKPGVQIDFMNECWRVLEMDGIILITTPYATSFGYSQDPTHCSPWNEATPTYFTPATELYGVYRPKPWVAEKIYWDMKTSMEIVLRKISEAEGIKLEREYLEKKGMSKEKIIQYLGAENG